MKKWPPEKIEELRELIEQRSLTASQAAQCLGVTRNAIIGICHRQFIGLRAPVQRLTKTGKPIVRNRRVYEKPVASSVEPTPAVSIVPLFITLADLKPSHCRYPVQDSPYLFCGHPKQKGSSYCGGHYALCWTKPIRKPARPLILHRRAA